MHWLPFGGVLLPILNKHGVALNENLNLYIAVVSRSGKSVFMQELMLSVLGVDGKVFVLDYGRSFKRTCLILGGSYIEFDIKNPVSINLFSEVLEDDSVKSIEARSDFLSNFPSILTTIDYYLVLIYFFSSLDIFCINYLYLFVYLLFTTFHIFPYHVLWFRVTRHISSINLVHIVASLALS